MIHKYKIQYIHAYVPAHMCACLTSKQMPFNLKTLV